MPTIFCGFSDTISSGKESADRGFTLDVALAIPSPKVSAVRVDSYGFGTVTYKRTTTIDAPAVNDVKRRRQLLIGVVLQSCQLFQNRKFQDLFVFRFSPEGSAPILTRIGWSLKTLVCTRLKTQFNTCILSCFGFGRLISCN
jgi:hypothetical protein